MRLAQFFEDNEGRLSSSRLMFVVSGFTVLGVWTYACIHANQVVPFDLTAVGFVGTMMAGKLVQGISDNNSPPSQPTTKTQ